MKHSDRRCFGLPPFCRLALAASLAAASTVAIAADRFWNAGSGGWTDPAAWLPVGEPQTGDAVYVVSDDALARTVTYGTTLLDPTFYSLRIDSTGLGTITLSQTEDSLGVAGGYTEVGWAGTGVFEQSGGASAFDTVIVGSRDGSNGAVTLSGGTTTMNRLVVAERAGSSGGIEVGSGGNLSVTTDAVIGEIGNGDFSQDGGTSNVTTMIVGSKDGSDGSVDLSGGTATVHRLVVAENAGSTGSVAVTGSGTLNVQTDVVVGEDGNGSFSLSGGVLSVAGEGVVGASGVGAFQQSGGTSTFSRVLLGLTPSGAGSFDLTGGTASVGELVLGHDLGSAGTVNLGGTGNLIVTGDMSVGSGSVGVFNQTGGAADVAPYLFVGRAPSGQGTVNLSGGTLAADYLVLGHDAGAQGRVNVSGTGGLVVQGANVGLGGTGVLAVSGGSLGVNGYLYLGRWGNGSLEVSGGSASVANDVYLGEHAGSAGVVLVSNGTLDVGGSIAVGLESGGAGSVVVDGGSLSVAHHVALGTLGDGNAIQTGGTVSVGWSLFLGTNTADSAGFYEISGGGLSVAQQIEVGSVGEGSFTQSGGTVTAPTVLLGNGGGHGYYTMSGGTLTATNNLNVGNGLDGWGALEQRAGTVDVGSYLHIGVSPGSEGYYLLQDGNLSVGIDGTTVGVEGVGQFSNGLGTHSTIGHLVLGSSAAGSGTYHLGDGATLSSLDQYVGYSGTGTFVQFGGANQASRDLYVGLNATATGLYDLRGGTLSVAGNEEVGHLGNGHVVQTGGAHNVNGTLAIANQPGSEGVYELRGGSLTATALVNKDQFTYSGGSLATTVLVNDTPGTFTVTGPGERTVSGFVVNVGTFKVTDATVRFDRLFVNAGAYVSDPSASWFTDLQIDPTGYLRGGAGDAFYIGGDFLNHSTQSALWDTADALLAFTGAGAHELLLAGADLGAGPAAFVDNFAWGALLVDAGVDLILGDGNTGNLGTALYLDALLLADEDLALLLNLNVAEGISLYYNENDARNAYLLGASYLLPGGGRLAPFEGPQDGAVPEPATLLLVAVGLVAIALAWRDRRWQVAALRDESADATEGPPRFGGSVIRSTHLMGFHRLI